MKRLLILLVVAIFLFACGKKDEPKPAIKEDETETIVEYDREHELTVIDNDDLKIQLTKSRKETLENHRDWMKLMFVIENKKERTFEFYFDEIKLDKEKYAFDDLTPNSAKIEPGETQEAMLIVESMDAINFEEYIAGEFVYVDFEENVYEESFGEYISD